METSQAEAKLGAKRRKPSRRGCLIILAGLAVVLAAVWYVLMGQAAAPQVSSYSIDLPRIRQIAQQGNGKLPLRLNAIVVGEGSYPQVLVVAGSGLQPRKMIFSAYQLVYEDRTVVIDATMPENDYEAMFPASPFNIQAYSSLQQALQKSSLVLLTHAHVDHISGITRSQDASALIPKVAFTPEQLGEASEAVGMTVELRAKAQTVNYDEYASPAPGIVVMKAPGHSLGDQMIYIRLQNGNEFLLTGDVVWSSANITQATGRPLILRLLVHEDWSKNGGEIRALHDLAHSEQIHIIVSHDGPQLDEYIRQGLIGNGFE